MIRVALALLTLALASTALGASAQEVTNEESDVRHLFDEAPLWEADADASVELVAPEGLTVCRQGRIVQRGGYREAHMGCWSQRDAGGLRLRLPAGPGFLAVRNGLDLTWIGNGATTLHDADVLRIGIDDHLAFRAAGWVVVGLAVATVVVGAVGLATRAIRDAGGFAALIVGGAALFVGIALAFVGDGFQVSLAPPTSPPAE